MNFSHDPRASEHESIEARAAAWIAEADEGLTPEQESEFAAWRAKDPRHEAAVIRLQSAWQALSQLREFRPEAKQHPDPDLLAPTAESKVVPFPWKPVFATAAAALIAVTSFFYWGQLSASYPAPELRPTRMAQTHYETTKGGYQRATLPDGSVVELNENSAIDLVFALDERRVELRRGEVHFTVSKNKERPFVVEANGLDVWAVGTAFNVRLDPDAVQVLVTEGKVRFHETDASEQSLSDSPVMLPGDLAVVTHQSDGLHSQIERLNDAAVRDALSWQGSRLIFVDTPLSEVISQFNIRNKVQIQIADPELAGFLVGGSFHSENIEAFVRLMASNQGIQVKRPSPDVVVLEQTP